MLARFAICMTALLLTFSGQAEAAKLSKKDRKAVESGTASHEQKANYVGHAMTDDVQRYALLQAWAVNPADFPIETYTAQISEDRVPSLFRGTDAGKMLVENGAVSICLMEAPCADHLAAIAVQMNELPRETLVTAYRQKSQIDAELFREQIGSNLETAVASAAVAATPAPVATQSPAPSQSGQILDFLLDPYTNQTITRVVTANGNQQVIREEGDENVVLADLASTGEKFLVTTSDGKRYQANQVKLTWFGLLLIAGNELHSFDGEKHQQLFFPEGFDAAKAQRHDVYETGAIVLERQEGGASAFADLASIGRSFGLNKKLDYALLNLRNGRVEFFNVYLDGKNVHVYSNCVPREGGLFNECADIDQREGLYDTDGFINNEHYLWAIDWARTPDGLFAVAQEGNKITVTNMANGDRRLAFKRGLGINWFELDNAGDGNLTLTAKLGFKKGRITDLATEYSSLPEYEPEEAKDERAEAE